MMAKIVYYINDKKGYSYQIRPLIYDVKFISGFKANLFCKRITFLLAPTVGKPIHLDVAIVNKTRSSCFRV